MQIVNVPDKGTRKHPRDDNVQLILKDLFILLFAFNILHFLVHPRASSIIIFSRFIDLQFAL